MKSASDVVGDLGWCCWWVVYEYCILLLTWLVIWGGVLGVFEWAVGVVVMEWVWGT